MNSTIFKLDSVIKEYKTGDVSVMALRNTTFEIKKGELVVVLGPSGSGKSTLLNIIGGMDLPQAVKLFLKVKTFLPMIVKSCLYSEEIK